MYTSNIIQNTKTGNTNEQVFGNMGVVDAINEKSVKNDDNDILAFLDVSYSLIRLKNNHYFKTCKK